MTRIVRVPFLLAWPPKRYAAQVLVPGTIFVRRGAVVTDRLIAHELRHVDQIWELGLAGYWLTYLRALLAGGYEGHPMEVEANHAEVDGAYLQRARTLLRGAP